MKTSKTLVIKFEAWDAFKTRIKTTLKKGVPSFSDKHALVFNSVTDYQKFMTEQKITILVAILKKKPSSIYQLAQIVERDFANVQRDCVALAIMGFVQLEELGDTKKSKTPKLSFNYTRIEVQMPSLKYSHDLDLKKAA